MNAAKICAAVVVTAWNFTRRSSSPSRRRPRAIRAHRRCTRRRPLCYNRVGVDGHVAVRRRPARTAPAVVFRSPPPARRPCARRPRLRRAMTLAPQDLGRRRRVPMRIRPGGQSGGFGLSKEIIVKRGRARNAHRGPRGRAARGAAHRARRARRRSIYKGRVDNVLPGWTPPSSRSAWSATRFCTRRHRARAATTRQGDEGGRGRRARHRRGRRAAAHAGHPRAGQARPGDPGAGGQGPAGPKGSRVSNPHLAPGPLPRLHARRELHRAFPARLTTRKERDA
jgi:hypothetical protein